MRCLTISGINPLLPLPSQKRNLEDLEKTIGKYWVVFSISFVLGCQWKALPRCYGAPSTVRLSM